MCIVGVVIDAIVDAICRPIGHGCNQCCNSSCKTCNEITGVGDCLEASCGLFCETFCIFGVACHSCRATTAGCAGAICGACCNACMGTMSNTQETVVSEGACTVRALLHTLLLRLGCCDACCSALLFPRARPHAACLARTCRRCAPPPPGHGPQTPLRGTACSRHPREPASRPLAPSTLPPPLASHVLAASTPPAACRHDLVSPPPPRPTHSAPSNAAPLCDLAIRAQRTTGSVVASEKGTGRPSATAT